MDQNHLMIDAYGDYVESYIRQGWNGYFLTFMFNQLRGNRDGLLRQMEREVERVYATLITRVVRDPTHEKNKELLPRWIICPDLPVPKRTKMSLQDVTLNDGYHLQGTGLHHPVSRLRTSLDQHFHNYQDFYVKAGGALRSITATPITRTPKRVVGYGFKAIPRRSATFDSLLILPRTLSEVKDKQRVTGVRDGEE
ncbi:hypothetical protein [Microvirga arabica]|uniref:hypothetical protein n=1 Tax=Microvirga arabica TaxID=1128671 RepID=UPI0019397BFC|nr:hypothetical protein [Microvirga arabica]MBM1174565.1 hypothetical protein [Microvirga arabica]